MLFNLARHGISVRVSLLVEGTYVQGNMITAKQYLQRSAQAARQANVLGGSETLGETLASLFDAGAEPDDEAGDESNFITDRSNFYHLAEVCIFSSSNTHPIQLKEMRVKASAVSAFSLSTSNWEN